MEAQNIERVGERKIDLLKRGQLNFLDQQKSRFAKSGLGFDGSVLDALQDTQAEQHMEYMATKSQIAMDAGIARQHGAMYAGMADKYRDPMNLLISSGAIFADSRAAAKIFESKPNLPKDTTTTGTGTGSAGNSTVPNPYGTVASNGTTATSEYVVDHWRKEAGGQWYRT